MEEPPPPIRFRGVAVAAGIAVLIIGALWLLGLYARARGMPVEVTRDVVFAPGQNPPLKMDVYRPVGQDRPLPAVVLIPGSAWRDASREDLSPLALDLARSGYVALCVEYRVAPAAKFPDQLDDVQRAVRYARTHAGELRIEPERLGAMGHSAGGQLAALLGTLDTRDNSDAALAGVSSRVQAAVAVSAPMTFLDERVPPVTPAGRAYVMDLFGTAATAPATVPSVDLLSLASPLIHIDGQTAAFLLIHGTLDDLVPFDQSILMARALIAAGREVKLVPIHDEKHSLVRRDAVETWARESHAFFDRVFEGKSSP